MTITTKLVQILVFKTNILSKEEEYDIRPLLDEAEGILQWNIDHQDCDHVLRIVSDSLDPEDIEELVRRTGFNCTELPD
jgi:hypothetical protein